MGSDGSHSGQFSFGGEMQSMDGALTQRIWFCRGGSEISSPVHVAAGIAKK